MRGDGGPPVGFVAIWLAILVWNAYWWLFRIVVSVTVRNGTLEWESPLQRGRIPMSTLTGFRPVAPMLNIVRITHTEGRALLVVPIKGIEGLAAAIRDARPDLDVRLGAMTGFRGRMPGPSAWRPDA